MTQPSALKPSNRFKGRFVVVTETRQIVGKPTYKYLSFRSRAAASETLDRKNKALQGDLVTRAYIVDTVLQPHVILP